MAVHAHPDDEATGTGGVLAKAAAEGIRTVLVTCTDGRCGDGPGGVKPGEPGHDPEAVVALRMPELEKSCEILGISHLELLGYQDSGMMGWANGKTLFWIAAADTEGKKHKYRKGDIGFHHYAFRLRSRADVDALQAYLEEQGAKIVDPAGEYYDDYYAVFFLDPDGMKLEGMRYGERHEQAGRKRAAAKRKKAAMRTARPRKKRA